MLKGESRSPFSGVNSSVVALCWALYAARVRRGYGFVTLSGVSFLVGTTHRTAINLCVRQGVALGLLKRRVEPPKKTVVSLTPRAVTALEQAW